MSHEIIKSITIKNKEVWIRSCSNNVSPREYNLWHCKPLTKILQEGGQKELDKTILKEYWSGMFKAGAHNKYSRVISSFNYDKYNYESVGFIYKLDGNHIPKKYTEEECKDALYEHFLNVKDTPKGKFVVGNKNGCYILSTRKGGATTVFNKNYAKIYSRFLKAEEIAKRFDGFYPISLN